MSKKRLKPCEATTEKKVGELKTDIIETPKSWMTILFGGGKVHIRNQKAGKDSTGQVDLTFAEFKKMSDWFFGKK